MHYPRLDHVTTQTGGSRYAAVIVAAKRARQLNAHQRGWDDEGPVDVAGPRVRSLSHNQLTVALEEIAGGHIVGRHPNCDRGKDG